MNELDLTITFTTYPTDEQLKYTQECAKGYGLANQGAKVLIVIPRPPRPE